MTRAPGLPVSLPAASVSLSAAAPGPRPRRPRGRRGGAGLWSLVFGLGGFAFLPFSLGRDPARPGRPLPVSARGASVTEKRKQILNVRHRVAPVAAAAAARACAAARRREQNDDRRPSETLSIAARLALVILETCRAIHRT